MKTSVICETYKNGATLLQAEIISVYLNIIYGKFVIHKLKCEIILSKMALKYKSGFIIS